MLTRKHLQDYLWILPFISFIVGYLFLESYYRIGELETPSVVGKNLLETFSILSKHDLTPRILTEKEDPDLPEGTILSQTPAAGKKIKQNHSVYLVISKQPAKIPVPSLVHKAISRIEQELKPQGFRIKSYTLQSNYPQCYCIAQHPAPHELVQEKKILTYISTGNTKPVLWPNVKNKPVLDVIDFLKTNNINPEIKHSSPRESSHTCHECIVIDQRPLAGSLVTLDPAKPMHVQLQVE